MLERKENKMRNHSHWHCCHVETKHCSLPVTGFYIRWYFWRLSDYEVGVYFWPFWQSDKKRKQLCAWFKASPSVQYSHALERHAAWWCMNCFKAGGLLKVTWAMQSLSIPSFSIPPLRVRHGYKWHDYSQKSKSLPNVCWYTSRNRESTSFSCFACCDKETSKTISCAFMFSNESR